MMSKRVMSATLPLLTLPRVMRVMGVSRAMTVMRVTGIERIPVVEGRVTMCLRKGSMMSPDLSPGLAAGALPSPGALSGI